MLPIRFISQMHPRIGRGMRIYIIETAKGLP